MTDNDAVRRRLEMLADDELVAILLDKDEEQWRPEVYDMVASILESRGVSTRDVLATGSGESEHDHGNQLFPGLADTITLAVYFDPMGAHADRLALGQAGIRAWVLDGDSRPNGAVGASLQILPEDLAAAIEFIDAQPGPASELLSEAAECCCPRCGSREVTEVDEILDVPDSSLTVPASSERQVCFYHCAACNHNWSG